MRLNKLDLAAFGVLVGSAVAAGWPVWTGGYLTYLDNPVHLAELFALAAGEEWTDIGFCGFPLAYLHSPIWYGGLGLLVSAGLPAGPLFAVLLLIASLSPALAIYVVGRHHLPPLVALLLAWLLLVQRTALVGYGSVFGGMATFFIACGLLIVFVALLADSERSWTRVGFLALTLAALALTHLYVLAAAVLVTLLHSAHLLLLRPEKWVRTLLRDATAYGVAALSSSLYWYPAIRGMAVSVVRPQNLEPKELLLRLFLPTDVLAGVQKDLYLLDAVPLTALVLLGVVGAYKSFRWPAATSRYGALLALSLAVLLFVLLPLTDGTWLGPNSWRFLFVARIGLALAALAALRELNRIPSARDPRAFAALATVMLVASPVLGSPLRSQVAQPAGEEWRDLRKTWEFLRGQGPFDGRVFVQSTLMTEPRDHPLVRSHVLALTGQETGVSQVGAYYGIVPYGTRFITAGEFGQVLGVSVRRKFDPAELRRRIELTNTTHLLMADPAGAESVVETGFARIMARFGRFTVLRADRERTGWVVAGAEGMSVREWAPGRIVLDLPPLDAATHVVVSQSFHPGWTASGAAGLGASPDGLLELSVGPGAGRRLDLVWKPYRAHIWLSAVGLVALLLWLGTTLARARRHRA